MKTDVISKHIECFTLISKTGVSWKLCKYLKAEEIETGCRNTIELGIEDQIKSASLSLQKKVIKNFCLMKYVKNLLLENVPIQSIDTLFEQSDEENIIEYKASLTAEVLLDINIPREFWFLYLKHYASMQLDEQQKGYLWKSLGNYQSRTGEGDDFIEKNKMLFCSPILAGNLIINISEYKEILERLVREKEFENLLELLDKYAGEGTNLDDENYKQLSAHVVEMKEYLQQIISYFSDEKISKYINLWLENHALLYDLQKTLKRIHLEGVESAFGMLQGRTAYIAFLYHIDFPELHLRRKEENLLIYAISHKKKHFLSLVKKNLSIFEVIPSNSILFQTEFYTKLVNLNTLNERNLKECTELAFCSQDVIKILIDKEYTFDEVYTIINMPIIYIKLYAALDISRIDDKLRVIREIRKRKCLPDVLDQNSMSNIAEKLSIKMLSKWMEQEFSGINGINAELSILLLKEYENLKHLIPAISSDAEAAYIVRNSEVVSKVETIEQVRENILSLNKDWLKLKSLFKLDATFVDIHKEQIRRFLYEDGANIMLTYYKTNENKYEELRRLIVAELMGRFQELKYFGNDLSLELEYPVADYQKEIWKSNSKLSRDNLMIWEEDGLLPVMKIGECPYHTCLSYRNGDYNQCLLACFDSNKKIVFLSYNKKIVLRAAIRLTKGCFMKIQGREESAMPQLEFADLEQSEIFIQKKRGRKEYLTLFLEHSYIGGLPGEDNDKALQLLLDLILEKARALNALLVVSPSYKIPMTKNGLVKKAYSIYISKSKAGEQYLDSLGGANTVAQEGNYYWNDYYILT